MNAENTGNDANSSTDSVIIQPNEIPTFSVHSWSSNSGVRSARETVTTVRKHVCLKTSINPFFNLLRLYRQLPESNGKSACLSAMEGACIWRAMTPTEKCPFQKIALKESKRRFNNNRKMLKSDVVNNESNRKRYKN